MHMLTSLKFTRFSQKNKVGYFSNWVVSATNSKLHNNLSFDPDSLPALTLAPFHPPPHFPHPIIPLLASPQFQSRADESKYWRRAPIFLFFQVPVCRHVLRSPLFSHFICYFTFTLKLTKWLYLQWMACIAEHCNQWHNKSSSSKQISRPRSQTWCLSLRHNRYNTLIHLMAKNWQFRSSQTQVLKTQISDHQRM